jgi:hypothetical protein
MERANNRPHSWKVMEVLMVGFEDMSLSLTQQMD